MKIINDKYTSLENFSEKFKNSKPFPHIVFDNFLDQSFFSELDTEEFNIEKFKNAHLDTFLERNKSNSRNVDLSDKIRILVKELNSDKFVNELRKLTGIDELFQTSVGNTALSNYHEMYQSGFVGTHVDHSSEPETGYPHVLNILIYLTKHWKESWGGSTILANKNGRKIEKIVNYTPNRAVIFLHSPFTFHGVQELNNNKKKRSSVYVDYYSKNKQPYKHLNLDFKNVWFKHPATFILPSVSDYFKWKNRSYLKRMFKHKIKSILA
jgi:Rps23 Pro-64 3,4-dihydroxylase Tpa1-like proline 4-hydroxylase